MTVMVLTITGDTLRDRKEEIIEIKQKIFGGRINFLNFLRSLQMEEESKCSLPLNSMKRKITSLEHSFLSFKTQKAQQ